MDCLRQRGRLLSPGPGRHGRKPAAEPATYTLWTWFTVGKLDAAFTIRYDHLAAVMALAVTLVATLVHLYSVAYMRDDEGFGRYFCYLNLFVFAMLVIVVADNLLFLFLGWEGVGFCSYALIGFWFQDPANATAGRKAFLVTRLGDVAFLIATGLAVCHLRHRQHRPAERSWPAS